MPFYSPLRYPGGKRKLANFFKILVEQNGLSDGHYVEIYAGGAGVALDLLFDRFVSHIHVNDLDRAIYAFWHSVLYETEALCEQIQTTDVTMEEWYRQRESQERADEISLFELGFSTFFLNRTNRSGILLGGVIGGKDQDSKYKMTARFNKSNLIQRIRRIGRHRTRISIYQEDAATFIQNTLPSLSDQALVYLDPPYYTKGEVLYKNFYEHEDHEQIAHLITQTDQRWVVTYDNTPEIRAMYADYPSLTYGLNYSAAERYEGSEVMFLHPGLAIPDVDNPSKVSKTEVYQGSLSPSQAPCPNSNTHLQNTQ
jgi:DNA adenine methylase